MRSTKRTSAQAALDSKSGEGPSTARLILPIPKRPRMAMGWRPTVGEVPSDGEDDKSKVKLEMDDVQEFFAPPPRAETRMKAEPDPIDGTDWLASPVARPRPIEKEESSAHSAHYVPSPSSNDERKHATLYSQTVRACAIVSSVVGPTSGRRYSQRLLARNDPLARTQEDNESEDDNERWRPTVVASSSRSTLPFPPLPSLHERLKAEDESKPKKKAPKLKSSGLSMFLQKMDVDSDEQYSSPSNSAYASASAGPSSAPRRPTRSGLATGDVFSPRRAEAGEHTKLEYSSPFRVSGSGSGLMEDDSDDGARWAGARSYVFRGRKVSQLEASPEV